MSFLLVYLAGVFSTILVYFTRKLIIKLLNIDSESPIIKQSGLELKTIGKKSLKIPKVHTEQMEYDYEKKLEGEYRGR